MTVACSAPRRQFNVCSCMIRNIRADDTLSDHLVCMYTFVELLWTCVDLLWNCGPVVDLCGPVFEWTCCGIVWTCCGHLVDLLWT